MRILIVHYNVGAPGQGAGGAESAVADQTEALRRLGHEVQIAYTHPERHYARWKPDIIHFHTIHEQIGLACLSWAQKLGVPHCLSLHDYWPWCGGRMLLKALNSDQPCAAVEGVCDGQCGHERRPSGVAEIVNGTPVVVFNPYSAKIYLRHGIRVDAIIPHGIDTAVFLPDERRREPGAIVTMSAWAFAPTKGMHVLRAALAKLGAKGRLIQGIERSQVPGELQKADIFVFPSTYEETWGLCLTEAMACGCACIASDVCGPRTQIQDGITGLLVPPRDVDALAAAIGRLLDAPGLRTSMGIMARGWAEQYANLERMGRDYERFYQSLMR